MADNDTSGRMATRSKNASVHPGDNKVPKRKRRTKEEMKIAREKNKAAQEAKALKEKQAATRIADIEKKIKDKNDDTPRPGGPALRDSQTRSQTCGITCNLVLMAKISFGLCTASDSRPVDEYQPSCSESNAANADDTLSFEEETPVKKKARTDKPLFRDTVKMIQGSDTQAVVRDARKELRCTYAVADLAGQCADDAVVSNK